MGAFARSITVVFATDVELDGSLQDTYVPSTTKILGHHPQDWKSNKRITINQKVRQLNAARKAASASRE